MKIFFVSLFVACLLIQNYTQLKKMSLSPVAEAADFYTVEDFKRVEKIDAHVHVNTDEPIMFSRVLKTIFVL